jgi:RNA polymerase sigma-70 factor (ECF subfamily)
MLRYLDPDSLERHLDRLYGAAMALTGSREQAEDLVQETCARVLAKPRLVRRPDDVGYLLAVLRNTFFDEFRQSRSRIDAQPLTDEVSEIADPKTPQPEAALESKAVYEAVARLPEAFRDACVAVDIMDLSYKQAARVLGVPEGTLTSRLFRARRALVAELSQDEAATRNQPVDPRSRHRA